ncbi:MAG TPA: hypothetical protein VLJ41_05390, partial [Segetibacter sp.]|nr:hypothetical protein [Segetibacter sp.]
KYDIEHIPVMNGEGILGAVSESGLFQKIFSNPEIKSATVSSVIEPAYPIVSFDTPVERLGRLITKGNGAVMAKDEGGNLHIVTKYDVINSLAK